MLYNRPYKAQLGAEELQALADAIRKPPHHLSPEPGSSAFKIVATHRDPVPLSREHLSRRPTGHPFAG
ncbi:hypothetical protein [Desulfosarcina sp.]|uniref:hypothetical protein n=1 Tax=Desulfosarcina sp. TaxID=2027861 RepID=UPI00397107DD